MAGFDADRAGLDAAIRQLAHADLFDDEARERILRAGAEALVPRLQQGARKHTRTGQLVSSIKADTKIRTYKDGTPYIIVSPTGSARRDSKHKAPVRNAVKGFVVNYGRRNRGLITGDKFWTRAAAEAEPAVLAAMQAEAEKITNERSK